MNRANAIANCLCGVRASAAILLLSAFGLLALQALGAEGGDRHGVIAFSQGADGGHAWGIAWSYDSEAGAEARAIEECGGQGGGNCVQVGWFRNACGALAVGGGNGFGAGWGDTKAAAERDALSECEFRNASCRVVVSRCAEPEEEEEEGDQTAWKAGDVFRDCPACPEMVVVPAGRFRMGCLSNDDYCYDREKPVHEVTIPRAFALSAHEVTFAQWDACAAAGGCNGYRPDDEGRGRGDRPVIYVSWEDAQSYVSWLSRETGEEYRLPSEAEWEYAARAGTATKYSWGNEIGSNRGNCILEDYCGDQWKYTAPVGSFAPNAFGLYDMHGNVWEWVEDCWNGSYSGAPSDGSAWRSGNCSRRVLRGGSWLISPRALRAASRSRISTGYRDLSSGFRVARTLTP